MTTRSLIAGAAGLVLIAGCGSSVEARAKAQYSDYAASHHFSKRVMDVQSVTCTHDATKRYDGWCRIRPKGSAHTWDVPYQGDKFFWGASGLALAPNG